MAGDPILLVSIPLRAQRGLNNRGNWRKQHARVKQEKLTTGQALLTVPKQLRAVADLLRAGNEVIVTLTRVAPRPLDDDNASAGLKSVRDAIAAALNIDDRDRRAQWGYAQRKGKPKEYAVGVRIDRILTIEEVAGILTEPPGTWEEGQSVGRVNGIAEACHLLHSLGMMDAKVRVAALLTEDEAC